MPVTGAGPDRTLRLLLVVVGLVIALAVGVVLTRAAPAPLDPATPAGTVQRYVAAVLAGDQQGAASYLAPSAAVGREPGIGADPANSSVEVQSATERGGSAEVRVLISTRYGSGPFSGGYERSDAFSLIRSSQAGKIESGPWEFFPCPGTCPSCCLSLPPFSRFSSLRRSRRRSSVGARQQVARSSRPR